MTTIAATPEQRIAVGKHLAAGRDLDTVARITGLPRGVVDEISARQQTAVRGKPAEHLAGLVSVPVDQVHPSPNNPREKLTDIDELAESIRGVGLIQPLVVQTDPAGGYQIISGHRRYAAIRLLGSLTVECIVRRAMRPDEELLRMLVENGQRAGLDPIEEARALNRLKTQLDITETEVARRVGRPISFVTRRIALLSLPVEEQEQLRLGITSMGEANVKARVASGRIRRGAVGRSAPGHLAAAHPLAARAKAACLEQRHSRGKGVGVGGIACGLCWEAVIRANEREKIQAASAVAGRCLICGAIHDPDQGTP